MADILIRGMEMPEDCIGCPFESYNYCLINEQWVESIGRPGYCPLIALPVGHGRLVDADVLNKLIDESYPMTDRVDVHNGYAICQELIKQLPTTCREAADAIEELSRQREYWELEAAAQETDKNYLIDENRKLVEAWQNALYLRNRWISVEEQLPEFDQKVLAWVKNKDPKRRFNPDGIYTAELKDKTPEPDPEGKRNFWGIPGYDSAWTVWSWSYFSEPDVLYWMPLPEPPKEATDA